MRKNNSQIWFGLVCIILGFMVTYQFKIYSSPQNKYSSRQWGDIVKEIDNLKKQKDELSSKVQEYQSKVDEYEKAAANVNETASKMKTELDNLRVLAGLTDVEGSGIIIKLTPINDSSSLGPYSITDQYLIMIVNDLNASGAEAISINDERFVGRTQIRTAGSFIKINDSKFSPYETFSIKAIGDPNILDGAFKMPGNVLDEIETYGVKVEKSKQDNIKILKYTKSIDFKYAK